MSLNTYDEHSPLHPANEQQNNDAMSYGDAMDIVRHKCSNEVFEAVSGEWESQSIMIKKLYDYNIDRCRQINNAKRIVSEIHQIETDPFPDNAQQLSDKSQRLAELKKELLTILNIETE